VLARGFAVPVVGRSATVPLMISIVAMQGGKWAATSATLGQLGHAHPLLVNEPLGPAVAAHIAVMHPAKMPGDRLWDIGTYPRTVSVRGRERTPLREGLRTVSVRD
jgi:hypothetical protein